MASASRGRREILEVMMVAIYFVLTAYLVVCHSPPQIGFALREAVSPFLIKARARNAGPARGQGRSARERSRRAVGRAAVRQVDRGAAPPAHAPGHGDSAHRRRRHPQRRRCSRQGRGGRGAGAVLPRYGVSRAGAHRRMRHRDPAAARRRGVSFASCRSQLAGDQAGLAVASKLAPTIAGIPR